MILVTGAAGFIGSILLRDLNEKLGRKDIIIVDRIDDNNKLNLKKAQYEMAIDADDLFSDKYEELLGQVSAIFHMGACSSTTERDLEYLEKNNVQYSKNLFELSLKNDCPFIYASSAATYGDGDRGYNDESINDLKPLNPYGDSKQAFDLWMLSRKSYPKKWVGLKFFNVYGPNEYHKQEMRSLVHKAFGQVEENGLVNLFKSYKEDFEDGKQLRDFVYVKDVSQAMITFFKENNWENGIYNLGTGEARSFYDLVSAVFKAQEKEVNIKFIEMPESIKNQYQYFTKANMSKFFKAFPNFKFSSIEEGVADYVSKHLQGTDKYY